MRLTARVLIVPTFFLLTVELPAASEIVIAIRYLQAEGTSHSHLYLYREDGKILRQLTTDNSGQDVDPIFAPDGEVIAFTRKKDGSPLEFWNVHPLGGTPTKLDAAPDWYQQTKTASYFTNRDVSGAETPSSSASPTASAARAPTGMMGERKS